MTRSGRPAWSTPGHLSIGKYGAIGEDGTLIDVDDVVRTPASDPVPGRCGCTCGATSEILPTRAARMRWHVRHREEAGRAPWSDVVRAAEVSSKWPAVLNTPTNGAPTFFAWRERSPNCWSATAGEGFVARAAVVETADGSGDTWVGHVLSDNAGEGAVRILYFRLFDVLAERLRDVRGGGWEVGCRRCGERWPCPVREHADHHHSHPDAKPAPDALEHVPYGVIKHG